LEFVRLFARVFRRYRLKQVKVLEVFRELACAGKLESSSRAALAAALEDVPSAYFRREFLALFPAP